MSVKINYEIKKVKEYFDDNNYESLSIYIKNIFKIRRDNNGELLIFEFNQDNADLLHSLLTTILSSEFDEKYYNLLIEVFRALRNCVLNPEFKIYLTNNVEFLNNVTDTIERILKMKLNDKFMQVILQFLINITVLSKTSALVISEKFLDIIIPFLQKNICIYETSALLYNISLYKPLDSYDIEFYQSIFELSKSCDNNTEFLHFLIETFLNYEKFWNFYTDFYISHRIIVLDIIKEIHGNARKLILHDNALKVLPKYFSDSCCIMFQANPNMDDLLPYEVFTLLEILASLTSIEKYLRLLQNNKDFVITCCVVLLNMHELGKQPDNNFTIINKLSEITNKDIQNHPKYGFKVGLVRVLANLCWRNEIIQNLIRESDVIPVLLECCNIDAKNPFIMQWAIFSIRNLCENNSENQSLISGLHKKGTVSDSIFNQFGLSLHDDGGKKITLVPLERLQK